MHPRLHPERRIAPCIIVCQISQLSPHVLIQSMRTSFVASAKKKTTSGAGEREKLKIQEAPPLL